jgi:hypothetical protein
MLFEGLTGVIQFKAGRTLRNEKIKLQDEIFPLKDNSTACLYRSAPFEVKISLGAPHTFYSRAVN